MHYKKTIHRHTWCSQWWGVCNALLQSSGTHMESHTLRNLVIPQSKKKLSCHVHNCLYLHMHICMPSTNYLEKKESDTIWYWISNLFDSCQKGMCWLVSCDKIMGSGWELIEVAIFLWILSWQLTKYWFCFFGSQAQVRLLLYSGKNECANIYFQCKLTLGTLSTFLQTYPLHHRL